MTELLQTIIENMKTAVERAKGLEHEIRKLKDEKEEYRVIAQQQQRLYMLEQEANEKLREKIAELKRQLPNNPSQNYQTLYEITAVENEKLLKALRGDISKIRSSLLVAELARRVDLIEGEL